jgi:outer membrane lipoprotein-sorting protein
MKGILMLRMKNSVLCAILLAVSVGWTQPADQLYSALERRLQALKSLEIRYEAETAEVEGQLIAGRMLWEKPDRFLHETPEWTLCETGDEQWRYLKEQNTLIREDVRDNQSEWLPEEVLFNLRKNFRASGTGTSENGHRVLRLEPTDAAVGGEASLEFPVGQQTPDGLRFTSPDGTQLRYRISSWRENIAVDTALFSPPAVPVENIIDFRGAGQSR